MTRTGSLVYYLAAIVCGCLFMTLAITASGVRTFSATPPGFRGIFLLYFLCLVYGWFSAAVFAVVLRLFARLTKIRSGWQWALAGLLLTPGVIWALSVIWTRALIGIHWPTPLVTAIVTTLFFGPVTAAIMAPSAFMAFIGSGLTGAATALVLFSIHRAFEPNKPPTA